MKQTTLSDFRDSIVKTGGYVSSPDVLAPEPRKKGRWTTFGFTLSVFFVFPYCAVREFFRSLTTELWALCCFKAHQKAERYGIKVTADGWENRNGYKGPVVYLSNHMSTLEGGALDPDLPARSKGTRVFAEAVFVNRREAGGEGRRAGHADRRQDGLRADPSRRQRVAEGFRSGRPFEGHTAQVRSANHWHREGNAPEGVRLDKGAA